MPSTTSRRRRGGPGVPGLTLVTGGARSGKSRHALALAAAWPRPAYVATAEAVDAEMAERIRRHRAERGTAFHTVEAPLDLAGALDALPPGCGGVVVDCLTVWLGNLLHHRGEGEGEGEAEGGADLADPARLPPVADLLRRLEAPPLPLVVVTNEVGWGIVPDRPLGRTFRDLAGRLNEEVARRADRVVLVVCGRPLELPGGRGG